MTIIRKNVNTCGLSHFKINKPISIEIRVLVHEYIYIKRWYEITYPCLNYSYGLTNPPEARVMWSGCIPNKQWTYSLIYAQMSAILSQ